MEIVLVGTVHRHPAGYRALKYILEEERPGIITVEISPYSLKFRRRRRELLEVLAPQALPFMEIPYEFRAASDWGKEASVPVLPVDLCPFAKKLLRQAQAFLRTPSPALVDFQAHLRLAKRCWEDPSLARLYSRGLHPKRERAMAKRIRELLYRHPDRKLLHLGGWVHLLDAPGTLYSLLSDLSPRRILMDPEGEK